MIRREEIKLELQLLSRAQDRAYLEKLKQLSRADDWHFTQSLKLIAESEILLAELELKMRL